MTSSPLSVSTIAGTTYARDAPTNNRLDERLLVGKLRRELLASATGDTLDLACGDGVNFLHYPAECRITAGDIDQRTLARARETARFLNRPVDVQTIDAQSIPYADDTFNTVVSSLALCSYPDPLKALAEMSRVCRADGRLLLLEHGRSSFRLWAKWQDFQERKRGDHAGCHENREPLELVRQAGLQPISARRTWFGIVHVIEAQPAR